MAKKKKCDCNLPLFLLRVSFGILFIYAGLTKVMNPEWTAAGFLAGAKTFNSLYAWFAAPANIGVTNFLNSWGQVLIGLGLLTGTFTRLASYFAMLLMALYYFPVLDFPAVGAHGWLVDEHIIYIFALAVMAKHQAGNEWGLDKFISKKFKLKVWWF